MYPHTGSQRPEGLSLTGMRCGAGIQKGSWKDSKATFPLCSGFAAPQCAHAVSRTLVSAQAALSSALLPHSQEWAWCWRMVGRRQIRVQRKVEEGCFFIISFLYLFKSHTRIHIQHLAQVSQQTYTRNFHSVGLGRVQEPSSIHTLLYATMSLS